MVCLLLADHFSGIESIIAIRIVIVPGGIRIKLLRWKIKWGRREGRREDWMSKGISEGEGKGGEGKKGREGGEGNQIGGNFIQPSPYVCMVFMVLLNLTRWFFLFSLRVCGIDFFLGNKTTIARNLLGNSRWANNGIKNEERVPAESSY